MSLERTRLSRVQRKILRGLRNRIAELESENKALRAAAADTVQRERERIGQDLHDGLCQFLSGIKFKATLLEEKLNGKAPREARGAAAIESLVNDAIQQARNIARGLQPVGLEARGLMSALQALAASTTELFGVNCTCRCQRPVLVHDHPAATHLYRIAQEAINNALRHGQPSRILVRLSGNRERLTLTIQDDGGGFPSRRKNRSGMGLSLMQYRARSLGGTLQVGAAARVGGTIVKCLVPRLILKEKPIL
jgi:signal transduction histidine kinase